MCRFCQGIAGVVLLAAIAACSDTGPQDGKVPFKGTSTESLNSLANQMKKNATAQAQKTEEEAKAKETKPGESTKAKETKPGESTKAKETKPEEPTKAKETKPAEAETPGRVG